MSDPVVDVHCHVFNANDLPVAGFINHLRLRTPGLGALLSELIQRVVQGEAPTFAQDLARIQALLKPPTPPGGSTGGATPHSGQRHTAPGLSDADVAATLSALQTDAPDFVRRLDAAMTAEHFPLGAGGIPAGAMGFSWAGATRAVRWAKLFTLSRLDIAAELVTNFSDVVDLFCPLLVDLGPGLGLPKDTMAQQVQLLEGISVLSMQGKLPGAGKARLHPFVGYDPRSADTPLDVVKSAVLDHGFVGVKVYPPMGWRPLGNTKTAGMSAAEAKAVDRTLRSFYDWCQANDVPVTAHANRSNYAEPQYAPFSGPLWWGKVLAAYPRLHLNLGHFGGAEAVTPQKAWPWGMARLAQATEHVYADVGDQGIYLPQIATGYLATLQKMFADPGTTRMPSRLMYGSDWFMLALQPDHEKFLTQYRALYSQHFPSQTADFMGGNALQFLGFGDPTNKNRQRLQSFYAQHAPAAVPAWL
jgi:predicted TIM-barrel fold metal-dependent hydrolase